MNDLRDYAEIAAHLLRRRPVERLARGQRDRDIGVIAQAMAERVRRKRLKRGLMGAAAAAALALLGVGGIVAMRAPDPPAPSAACAGDCEGSSSLVGRSGTASYPPGSHLISADEPLSVTFGPITRIQIEPRSELVYQQARGTQRFRLLYGAVRVHVETLAKEQRFIVETRDAEVEVRGTTFEVALVDAAGCDQQTRVRVSEGTVEVRASNEPVVVRAGENFEVGCMGPGVTLPPPSTPIPASTPPPQTRAAAPRPLLAPRAASEEALSAPTPAPARSAIAHPASNLAFQNDLYARAVAARNLGKAELALELYAELESRFPGGPLAESAMIERVRLLKSRDRALAAQEARRYLRRFPHGFAREEAEALARP